MVTLTDLGFSKNMIYETLVCTYNPDGVTANAAPMGAVMQNLEQISLTIYNSASTLKNLQTHKSATLNLTDNIELFFQTALKDTPLPEELFEKSPTVNAPQLKPANATIALTIQDFNPLDSQRTKITGKICQIDALKIYPQSYCRAKSAVLEAIIHATRIKTLYKNKKEQAHLTKLVALIQNCNEVVNRSAPNSPYTKLMSDLQKKIDTWSPKHEGLC
ncbi:MAG: DUF447 family protein [Candidatus Bathyarchaeota archaeon]|nr:DUF447 family protein [Candidatus Termiticorpusculum sp.]